MTDTIKSTQLESWRGLFGNAYTERNAVTAERLRIYTRAYAAIWQHIATDPPASILECGCNVGIGLRALSNITSAELSAIEPNDKARAIAASSGVAPKSRIVEGIVQDIPFPDNSFELAFTSGVLIHVSPDDLDAALSELARVSRKYVLMIEYYSKNLEEIDYRGQHEMLWKADYGALFMEKNPGWRPIEAGFFWNETTGFDDSNWWLFRRTDETE